MAAVLVVEDHPINMKLATDLLTFNGFQVLQARDGETALQLLATQIPSLVLLDIGLPGLDGLEVFRRIKADPRMAGVPVVALTASAMKEEEQRISALGVTDYLAKPFDVRVFVALVRRLTGTAAA